MNNVADHLHHHATAAPDRLAVAAADRRSGGHRRYDRLTFAELDRHSSAIAAGLLARGARPGMRLALLVKPGVDFILSVYALLKAGAVMILIDPGMGRKNLIGCLEEARPEGFVAVSAAQAIRCLLRRRFAAARLNVTVGRRWFWGGPTLAELRRTPVDEATLPRLTADDPAAIIFTTGSTGPPKGVLYTHGNFTAQIEQLRDHFGVEPGEADLSGFPLFALFNAAMGVTTVMPRMDYTRPAHVDPQEWIAAAADFRCTQAFGSPALWNTVGKYLDGSGEKMPTLRRLLSAGAPVPPRVLRWMTAATNDSAEMHTPYGATEALPVASISAREVLGLAAVSDRGAGTCVGRRFSGIRWRVVRITDEPIAAIEDAEELPPGEIGELIVSGPVVTRRYVTREDQNPLAKIADGQAVWHRMGDVGYLDEQQRFWFCGRKSHRVDTLRGTLFTVPCEAVFSTHPQIYRSALVGLGERGSQRPVVVVETWPEHLPRGRAERTRLVEELQELAAQHEHTSGIADVLLHRGLPVDIRHNSKIFRERLVPWAARRLA